MAVYLSAQQPVLIILNRLQPENFTCSLAQVGEVEVQGELLMFKLGTESKWQRGAGIGEHFKAFL